MVNGSSLIIAQHTNPMAFPPLRVSFSPRHQASNIATSGRVPFSIMLLRTTADVWVYRNGRG